EAVDAPSEAEVDHEHVRAYLLAEAHRIFSGHRGGDDVVTFETEVEQHEIEDGLVVVRDDESERLDRHRPADSGTRSADSLVTSGSVNAIVAPPPSRRSAQICPPWAVTIIRQM